MIIRGGKGDLAVGTKSQDLLLGEQHVLQSTCGVIFFNDPGSGYAMIHKILRHACALADNLIRALAAGGDEGQMLSCKAILFFRKGLSPVQTSLKQRRGSSISPQTAAQAREKIREIQKGVFQEIQIKREYLTLSKACGVPRFV